MSADALPLFDLARRWATEHEAASAVFERIGAAGAFSLGKDLAAFEAEFAAFCGTAYCVGVANGTVALELALRACGAGPGSEVVTVAHTFVATVEAIAATGATPVLVDVEAATRTIAPAELRAALSPRTAAVVPVHLYGRPADMDAINTLCAARGVAVVEDAAQAHGARLGERRAGALGTVGCFSFYPTKNLGAMGDGGAVTTDDEAIAAMVRSLRHHGSAPGDANRHEYPGGTERLDNLQAALLRLRLRVLDEDNAQRVAIADRYRDRLADLPLTLPPRDTPGMASVYHLFVIETEDRDALRARLAEDGIATGVHYPTPVHLQPAWRHLGYGPDDLPGCERAARRVLSLPIFPGMRMDEVDRVCAAVERALEHAGA